MGLFKKLFGEKKMTGGSTLSGADERNDSHERLLKKDFGLEYGPEGWVFEGGKVIGDMAAQFSRPDMSLRVLKNLRDKKALSQVCVVATNKMVVLACNTKPAPTCFVSGLDTSGIAELVATTIKEGGKVFVYRGTWLLTL